MIDNNIVIQLDHSKTNNYYRDIIENDHVDKNYECACKIDMNIEKSVHYFKMSTNNIC